MARVSRPGGRILIWDHNPRNPYWSSPDVAACPQDTGEERLIGADEVIGGLNAAGAQVLSVQQLGLVPDFTPSPLVPRGGERRAPVRALPRVRTTRPTT